MNMRNFVDVLHRGALYGLVALGVLVISGGAWAQETPVQAVPRKIEEKAVETIETGLEYQLMGSLDRGGIGRWLSRDLFVVNASQDSPDARKKQLQKVVLIDARTGSWNALVPDGQIVCWNRERKIASFKPSPYNRTMGMGAYWFAHLDESGNMEPLPDKPSISPHTCYPEDIGLPNGGSSVSINLREGDGYIKLSEPGKSFPYGAEALLIQPGKPPKGLGIKVEDIWDAVYLPFINKYLLKIYSKNANQDRKIFEARRNHAPLPPRFAPSYLMSPGGDLEELPFPLVITEFAPKGFYWIQPVLDGQLIGNSGVGAYDTSLAGLYLLRGEHLFRLWQKGEFSLQAMGIVRHVIYGPSFSPDGCRVAFAHAVNEHWNTPKPITIINVCKES